MASISQQYGIPGMMLFLKLTVLLTGCTKRSNEYYEMLGKQGQITPLLSELESDDAEVRANSLTGVSFAAQYARQDWALERNRESVDPAKLIPAVEPVIRALRDEDGFVPYCAGHALRCLAESVEDPQALARITNALVEHKPSYGNGDDYKHFIEGLSAIAANTEATPESRARARQILDADRS